MFVLALLIDTTRCCSVSSLFLWYCDSPGLMTQTKGVVSELEGKNANSDVPKEFNVTRAGVEQQHLVNVENQKGQVVKAEQNGTPTTTQPSTTLPAFASDNSMALARDTSSIPGISMLANQSIPPAVFKHEEVVASKQVFADALNKFHTVLGTRLT